MTSADPIVGDPLNGQNWNRYSYVWNNPLAYTDPTGYCPTCIGTVNPQPPSASGVMQLVESVFKIAVATMCTAASGGACTPFLPLVVGVTAAYFAGVHSGKLGVALKAGVIAYATAYAFQQIGIATGHNPGFDDPLFLPNVVGHALVGCGSSVASGGKCGPGALSAGVTAFAGPVINGQGFSIGSLLMNTAVGGLASVAGGGKFANGAVTAAFGYLANSAGTFGRQMDHDYTAGPNLVCAAELACSAQEIADQGARFSVPGRDPSRPVENQERYAVRDPWAGIPGGYVRTSVSRDGLTIINRTELWWHVFCCGQITRTFFQDDTGAWYAKTTGTGYNIIPGMGPVNQGSGPAIFDKLDAQMRSNILLHHLNN